MVFQSNFIKIMSWAGSVVLAAPLTASAEASVWTMRYDNNRSSTYLSEKLLNTANVNTASFGKLFTLASDDQVYTSPLYIADLAMAGGVHNVVFFGSVNNTLYAYDADNGALLWRRNLNNGFRPFNRNDARAFGACGGGYTDAAGNMGIIGTPVIDVKTQTLYVVAKTVENNTYPQRLYALDIKTGASRTGDAVVLSGSVAGSGDGTATVTFNSQIQSQRVGLALVNNVVYIAQSSYCDTGQYHGWVFGYNAGTLAQVALWNASPDSFRAGIWHAGQPPAADGSGNIFFANGNGINASGANGTRNFGESVVRLTQSGSGSLRLADFWTPGNWPDLDRDDADQGSSGVLLLPGQSRLIQGGKDGVLHLFDSAHLSGMGGIGIQQFQSTHSQNGGGEMHIHGAPIYWNGPAGGMLYVWGENDYLRTFMFNGTGFNPAAYRTGTVIAPQIGQGMPGAFLSLSARGRQTGSGVLWANAVYDGDANLATRPGILRAYDATNAVTELWNNHQTASDDCGYFAKGTHPVVINSKVYLSSFGVGNTTSGGQVCVYGLKNRPAQPYGDLPVYLTGFAGATQFSYNGSAYLNGSVLRLTDSRQSQAGSAFFLHAVPIGQFHAGFTFQIGAGSASADGMTFTLQGSSPHAVGASGGGLGYGADPAPGSAATGIPHSMAVKFDLYNNAGEGANSTGLFINGIAPTLPAAALPANIDFHSGHPFSVLLGYDGTTLSVTIRDTVTAAAATQNYAVNIPAIVGGGSAFIGFTGGTGGSTALQEVVNLNFTNP